MRSTQHQVAGEVMPWDVLRARLGFENEDVAFWWKHTAPVLGKFMIKSNYTLNQQYTYLSWFHKYIAPSLGPRPEPDKPRM